MSKIIEKSASLKNEGIEKSIKDLTTLCHELTQKYEKLKEDMRLLLSLEPISSASRLFSRRERLDCFDFVTVVYLAYVRYGELKTQKVFTNSERKPIVYKVVEEDICSTVLELVIDEKDAKEIVYLLVDKQNETVSDITRWYKNEEKK